MVAKLLEARDPETKAGLNQSELALNAIGLLCPLFLNPLTFSIAASDTVAVSLTYTMYHILSNPKVWNRLRDEIRSSFQSIEEMTGQSLAHLPYLDAVIHEGIRHFRLS